MRFESMSGIYEIRNALNGKRYIGSAVNLKLRWRQHRNDLTRKDHCNPAMQSACNKHGIAVLLFKPIMVCGKQDLLFYEQLFLDRFHPQYNINPVAGSRLGSKWSTETRAKMLVSQKGRKWTEESRAKISASHKGRKKSKEHVAKISASRTGSTWTDEQKRRYSLLKRSLCYKISEEQKAKIGAANARVNSESLKVIQYMKAKGVSVHLLAALHRIHWGHVYRLCRNKRS